MGSRNFCSEKLSLLMSPSNIARAVMQARLWSAVSRVLGSNSRAWCRIRAALGGDVSVCGPLTFRRQLRGFSRAVRLPQPPSPLLLASLRGHLGVPDHRLFRVGYRLLPRLKHWGFHRRRNLIPHLFNTTSAARAVRIKNHKPLELHLLDRREIGRAAHL